jgi:hypothetical protein
LQTIDSFAGSITMNADSFFLRRIFWWQRQMWKIGRTTKKKKESENCAFFLFAYNWCV